jgi:hypothetical protein
VWIDHPASFSGARQTEKVRAPPFPYPSWGPWKMKPPFSTLSIPEYLKVEGKRGKIAVKGHFTATFWKGFKSGESLVETFSQTMFLGIGFDLIKPAVCQISNHSLKGLIVIVTYVSENKRKCCYPGTGFISLFFIIEEVQKELFGIEILEEIPEFLSLEKNFKQKKSRDFK